MSINTWMNKSVTLNSYNGRVSQVVVVVRNLPANAGEAGDTGLIPGSGRSPGLGNGTPLQHSCWKIPWAEEPGRFYSPWGPKSRTLPSIHTHTRFLNLALALAPAPVSSCPYLPAPSQLSKAQTVPGRGQGSWQTLDALQKLHWQKSNADIQYQYAHRHTTKFKLTNHLNQLKFLLSVLVFC